MADSVGCSALWRVLGMGEREKKRRRGEKRRTYPLCAVCGVLCAVVCGGVRWCAGCAVCGVRCAVCCVRSVCGFMRVVLLCAVCCVLCVAY